MKSVEVDRAACEGTGYCVKVAPAVFRLGDDGVAELIVSEVPEVLEEEVAEAESLCPTLAIKQAILEREEPDS